LGISYKKSMEIWLVCVKHKCVLMICSFVLCSLRVVHFYAPMGTLTDCVHKKLRYNGTIITLCLGVARDKISEEMSYLIVLRYTNSRKKRYGYSMFRRYVFVFVHRCAHTVVYLRIYLAVFFFSLPEDVTKKSYVRS